MIKNKILLIFSPFSSIQSDIFCPYQRKTTRIKMVSATRLFFLYSTTILIKIELLVSMRELIANNIIVDVNKGYVL